MSLVKVVVGLAGALAIPFAISVFGTKANIDAGKEMTDALAGKTTADAVQQNSEAAKPAAHQLKQYVPQQP